MKRCHLNIKRHWQGIIRNMANIIANSTENKDIMQASIIKVQAYNMCMELVSNANLVPEAIDLVERYRGYTGQRGKVTIDNAEQPA
jgi:hypothetical protein